MNNDKWTAKNIPNLKGKVAIVTGSNSGIGEEAAKQLALKDATVILAVRTEKKGEQSAAKIKAAYPGAKLDVMELDLASLSSIKKFTATFNKKYKKLDILINNAGVMAPPYTKTEDGFELQFGTNHLGHFALTGRLMPLLENAKGARIVNVSSIAHTSGNINFDDLNWEKRDYSAWQAYGDSKLANLYFTYELARKLKDSDITVAAAHPGFTATNLQKYTRLFTILTPLLGQQPPMGALPTLRAATDPGVKSGDYYGPRGFKEVRGYPVKVESNKLSHDKKLAKKLWQESENLTGIIY